MEDWTCLDCTAINEASCRHCWKCKAPYRLPPAPLTEEEVRQSHFVNGDAPNTFRDLFLRRAGDAVLINCEEPSKQKSVRLVGVHGEYFSILDLQGRQQTLRHYPYGAILSCTEHDGALSIEVHRQVFTKGAFAVGMSIPI
ncbi:hypothetical protein [Cupriavidus basilensis]